MLFEGEGDHTYTDNRKVRMTDFSEFRGEIGNREREGVRVRDTERERDSFFLIMLPSSALSVES